VGKGPEKGISEEGLVERIKSLFGIPDEHRDFESALRDGDWGIFRDRIQQEEDLLKDFLTSLEDIFDFASAHSIRGNPHDTRCSHGLYSAFLSLLTVNEKQEGRPVFIDNPGGIALLNTFWGAVCADIIFILFNNKLPKHIREAETIYTRALSYGLDSKQVLPLRVVSDKSRGEESGSLDFSVWGTLEINGQKAEIGDELKDSLMALNELELPPREDRVKTYLTALVQSRS
jgi:hypothetical protein